MKSQLYGSHMIVILMYIKYTQKRGMMRRLTKNTTCASFDLNLGI